MTRIGRLLAPIRRWARACGICGAQEGECCARRCPNHDSRRYPEGDPS